MASDLPFSFAGLGVDQDEILQQELARALRLGKPSGRQYATPGGALFGGIGDVIGAVRGGKAYDETQAKVEALAGRRAAALGDASSRFKELSGFAPDASLPEDQQAAAMAEALTKREQLASELMSSGHAPQVDLGKHHFSQVGETRDRSLRSALEARKLRVEQDKLTSDQTHRGEQLKIDQAKLEQDAWGSIADPVTGGILLYNKKTGETRALGPGGGRPGDGLNAIPGKPTEKQRNAVTDAMGNISKLDMAIGALEKAPGAYGGVGNFVAGMAEKVTPGFAAPAVQAVTARQLKPNELQAKNFVTNVVSAIINARAGANVTLNEELRQKFVPQETDGLEQALQKLRDLREMELADYNAATGKEVSAQPPTSARSNPDAESRAQSYYED